MGLALAEVNALSEALREQRTGALEAAGLLRKIMAEIDAAIFAFDQHGRLRLANRAGERLLDEPALRLLRNAVEAAAETGGAVDVDWAAQDGWVELWVRDEGPGLAATANLFVPFFTTKPRGSGIGLALSRQIAEAHRSTLAVENRDDRQGVTAMLRLPV